MMPKGVEHRSSPSAAAARPGVERTMMPKGVEHLLVALKSFTGRMGGTNNDAERR